MLNALIFIALPYAALALLLVVTPLRFCSRRLTWSAYSTQFLERKLLYWGINPWHFGILPILIFGTRVSWGVMLGAAFVVAGLVIVKASE